MTSGESSSTTTAATGGAVQHRVVAAITSGRYRPGQDLDPAALAAETESDVHGVERALRELSGKRLVESTPDGRFLVATPTAADYDAALQVVFGFAELAARWAVPVMDESDVAIMVGALEDVRGGVDRQDSVSLGLALEDVLGPLLTSTPNPFFERAAVTVLNECQFLFLAESRFVFWAVGDYVDAFQVALRSRDGEAAAAGVRLLGRVVREHVEQQRVPEQGGAVDAG